ncbi:hypothetical protein P691DRAFT_801945 [Macrolepiota fuliginosa MF-IS2]|uniref:Uncharacterized protein n=1 Tax=Macrolepiota fuliginosa MF-IS2 TaxID=1400762 RepID=A0A9P5XKJ7_9AGAR|nr:hypothetical protein P691DRAFT_801945 [Macrolepiota fuliginosa MF-IS2]
MAYMSWLLRHRVLHTPSPETPRATTPKATLNRVEYMGRSDCGVVTDPVNQEPRQLAGAKHPNSQSTPSGPKRRRTEDEIYLSRGSNPTPVSSTQPPRTPERYQRPVVPPSPGAEISLR